MTDNPLSPAETEEIVSFLGTLADAAADPALAHFRQSPDVDEKASTTGFDPVTIADRDTETAIRRLIEQVYPDHGILGEEHGAVRTDARFQWIIDPIDGTRAYIAGVPVWTTLIALACDGRPIASIIAQPFTGERFLAWPGGATYDRGGQQNPLKTRPCAGLEVATASATHPAIFASDEEQAAHARLRAEVRMLRWGLDAYGYALLAMGHIDVIVEASLQAYDVAALVPVVEQAGGIITDWQGGPPGTNGQVLAAGSREVYDAARAALAG